MDCEIGISRLSLIKERASSDLFRDLSTGSLADLGRVKMHSRVYSIR